MKRFILIAVCLFLICGTMFYYVSIPRNVSGITAEGGVFDLSGGDFTNTLFNLDGEWEFYYEQLYMPEDFINGRLEGGVLINTPMSWSKAGYPLKGFATYRLTVKTDEPELMMLIPEVQISSVVWINGQKALKAGKLGKSSSETAPGLRNAFLTVHPENGNVEIIVQAANYGWYTSGLQYSISIARPSVLLNDALTRRILLGLTIGVLLAISLYHAILFIYSRREWIYLIFALLCVVVSMRFLVETNGFAQLFLPDGMGVGLIKLYAILMVLQVMCITVFTHLVFKKPIDKVRRTVYGVAFFAPLIPVLALPYGTVDFQVGYFAMIPMAIAFVDAVRSKRLRENPYNSLFLIALGIFCLWYPFCKIVLNDILYMQGVVTNMFLVLCQCTMLSVSYAETKRHEEELGAKTEFLNKLNHTKTEFLQDMSHEMKNPLTVIATGIDYADRQIRKEDGDLSEAGSALETIRDETQRLGRMVSSMVDLASVNEISENRKRVNFAILLQNIAEAFRPAFEQRNNSLAVEIAPGLPDVFVENDRFMQVMTNLFSNAADHTQDGQITLTGDYDSTFIIVCVTDTGCGIEPELLPDVFERGVSGRGGTGYGLYICKTIVEAHGGTIRIESAIDKGTTMTFTVPVYGGQEAGHKQ